MNGYIAFWGNKRAEIFADSLYQAKTRAIEIWRVPRSKQSMVAVVLAELNGKAVTHTIVE